MAKSLIKEKSYFFALEIIGLYKTLLKQNEYVLSKQLLKSGTSIGANVEEALAGQSRADFLSKMSIVHPVKSKEVTFNRARKRHGKQTTGLDCLRIAE